jgi:transcriptional regulator with XRE-family HTH domain
MERMLDKAREYVLALKEAGRFSYEDMANMSGIPQQTIRNFCTGKTAKNVGYENVIGLALALGGDMNELVGYEKKKEIEVNSTVSMKETYEMRIGDIINSYEQRIEDIMMLCEKRVEDVQKCCEIRIADLKQMFKEMSPKS